MHGQTTGNAGTYTTSHDIVILNGVKDLVLLGKLVTNLC